MLLADERDFKRRNVISTQIWGNGMDKQEGQLNGAARRRNGLRRAVLSSAAAVTITAVSAGAAAPAMAHGPKWPHKSYSSEASIEVVKNKILPGQHWDANRAEGWTFHLDTPGLERQTETTGEGGSAHFEVKVGKKGYKTVTITEDAQAGWQFRDGHCTDRKTRKAHMIRPNEDGAFSFKIKKGSDVVCHVKNVPVDVPEEEPEEPEAPEKPEKPERPEKPEKPGKPEEPETPEEPEAPEEEPEVPEEEPEEPEAPEEEPEVPEEPEAPEETPEPVEPAALGLTKTASVEEAYRGDTYTYDLQIEHLEGGEASEVVLTDRIHHQIRVDEVIVGEDDVWQACEMSDQDENGFGGLLTCELEGTFGADDELDPVQLDVTINPDLAARYMTNAAELAWCDADGENCDSTTDAVDVQIQDANNPWSPEEDEEETEPEETQAPEPSVEPEDNEDVEAAPAAPGEPTPVEESTPEPSPAGDEETTSGTPSESASEPPHSDGDEDELARTGVSTGGVALGALALLLAGAGTWWAAKSPRRRAEVS